MKTKEKVKGHKYWDTCQTSALSRFVCKCGQETLTLNRRTYNQSTFQGLYYGEIQTSYYLECWNCKRVYTIEVVDKGFEVWAHDEELIR